MSEGTWLNLESVHENGDETFTITSRTNFRVLKTHSGLNRVTSPEGRRKFMERIVACVNFCEHLSTETLEGLTKERVGAATFLQWIRRNPTRETWLYEDPEEVCIECNHVLVNDTFHAEDCLLKRAIDIVGKDM